MKVIYFVQISQQKACRPHNVVYRLDFSLMIRSIAKQFLFAAHTEAMMQIKMKTVAAICSLHFDTASISVS